MEPGQEQFLKAYDEHADALFRYCFFKVSNRETAKDLFQETFAKTWAYLQKGGQIDNMKSFLYRTLGNLVIDEYRKKKNVSLDALAETGFDYGTDPSASIANQIDGAAALKLLDRIPDDYRDVLFMRYVQELSIKEIAEITDVSENTISVRIHRGLEKVKKIFSDESQV